QLGSRDFGWNANFWDFQLDPPPSSAHGPMKTDPNYPASTITQRCASRPIDSWSPSGRRIPPRKQVPLGSSKKLQFPKLVARGVPPLRPERHVLNSIATVRRRLSVALVATLSRCPCCVEPISTQSRHRKL